MSLNAVVSSLKTERKEESLNNMLISKVGSDLLESLANCDKLKIFKIYFVENNYDQVLKKYKRKRNPGKKLNFSKISRSNNIEKNT